MIEPIRKRLTAIFTTVIVVFNVLIMAFSFIVLQRSLIIGMKDHLTHDIRDEYIYHVPPLRPHVLPEDI